MKYIEIGNFNKYHIYILIALLSEILVASFFGLNSSNSERPARIFPFIAKIKNHKLLNNFLALTSILIGGIILYFIERRNKRKKINGDVAIIDENEKSIPKKKDESITFNVVLIGVIFSLYVILKDFIDLSELTFWPLEILYIGIISYFLFKIKISRHKKFAICIMVTVTIIDIVESFFPTTKHKDLKNKSEFTDKNIFDRAIIKYGAYSIPLFYLANELKQFQRDYCWVNQNI